MNEFNINSLCSKYDTSIVITGQVFDTVTKETLPFTNVYLSADSSIGTAANEEGIFTITVPRGSRLTASFVGYHPHEFIVNDGFTKVFLTPDDQLDTVYLEGENKNKKSNWWLWGVLGVIAAGVIVNSSDEKKANPALGEPMKVKI